MSQMAEPYRGLRYWENDPTDIANQAEIARLRASKDEWIKQAAEMEAQRDKLRAALERSAWALDRIGTHLSNLSELDPDDKWIECGELVKNESAFARKALANEDGK
jgi:hypothetical protein